MKNFIGETLQTPPKYSAIKQNGKKLCDIVRKDKNAKIELPQRKIFIYSIELLDFNKDSAVIKVHCAKGVYIRSLCNDIGQILGCGAYMKALTRTKSGNFDIKNAQNINDNLIKINPLDVLDYEKYELNDLEYEKVKNGNPITVAKKIEGEYVLLTKHNKLVSIAVLRDNLVKPKKTFVYA